MALITSVRLTTPKLFSVLPWTHTLHRGEKTEDEAERRTKRECIQEHVRGRQMTRHAFWEKPVGRMEKKMLNFHRHAHNG